jgi:hypothetical protein
MNIRHIVICIIATITLSLVIACDRSNPGPGPGAGPKTGDDQPIVVVGGSLIMSASSGTWNPVSPGWEHSESQRHAAKIEVFYEKNGSLAVDRKSFNNQASIELSDKSGSPLVILSTQNGNQGLNVRGNGTNGTVDPPDVISFENISVQLVVLKENGHSVWDYTCPAKCFKALVIHYYK